MYKNCKYSIQGKFLCKKRNIERFKSVPVNSNIAQLLEPVPNIVQLIEPAPRATSVPFDNSNLAQLIEPVPNIVQLIEPAPRAAAFASMERATSVPFVNSDLGQLIVAANHGIQAGSDRTKDNMIIKYKNNSKKSPDMSKLNNEDQCKLIMKEYIEAEGLSKSTGYKSMCELTESTVPEKFLNPNNLIGDTFCSARVKNISDDDKNDITKVWQTSCNLARDVLVNFYDTNISGMYGTLPSFQCDDVRIMSHLSKYDRNDMINNNRIRSDQKDKLRKYDKKVSHCAGHEDSGQCCEGGTWCGDICCTNPNTTCKDNKCFCPKCQSLINNDVCDGAIPWPFSGCDISCGMKCGDQCCH